MTPPSPADATPKKPDLCPHDGKACRVGDEDNKHFRCGTTACGSQRANSMTVPADAPMPCPFCGQSIIGAGHRRHQDWNVWCDVCDIGTPEFETQAEAIAAWNRRPPATVDEAMPAVTRNEVRAAVIEECAKVAERHADDEHRTADGLSDAGRWSSQHRHCAHVLLDVATEIRALAHPAEESPAPPVERGEVK